MKNRPVLFAAVTLENVKIIAQGPGESLRPVGGLIGNLKATNCDSVRIESIYVSGHIQSGSSTFGISPAGGVAGRIEASRCKTVSVNDIAMYANIHLISDTEISGGVIGQFVNGAQDSSLYIARCYVDSTNYASKSSIYNHDCIYQGGIIGDFSGNTLSICESSVQGVIEHYVSEYGFAADHSVENAGGLAGRASFLKVNIKNCYVGCDISSSYVGGLIGLASCNGSVMESAIQNCCVRVREPYSTTYGTSNHRFGFFFAADAASQSIPIISSYYDTERLASTYATAYDYHYSGGSWAPYNRKEMPACQLNSAGMRVQSNFSGWDFWTIWKMGSSSPQLRFYGDIDEHVQIQEGAIIQAVHRYSTTKEMDQITGETYTLTADDIGKILICEVTSSVETGSISAATDVIRKQAGAAAPVGLTGVAPSSKANDDGKITGTGEEMEYSASADFAAARPCADGETPLLPAGTYYVRIKETPTAEAGASTIVTVPEYVLRPPIVQFPETDQIVTVVIGGTAAINVMADNVQHYQWFVDRKEGEGFVIIPGAEEATYTTSQVRKENDGYLYFCRVSNDDGHTDSPVFTLCVVQMDNIPETGDRSSLMLWITIVAVCGVGIWILARKQKAK